MRWYVRCNGLVEALVCTALVDLYLTRFLLHLGPGIPFVESHSTKNGGSRSRLSSPQQLGFGLVPHNLGTGTNEYKIYKKCGEQQKIHVIHVAQPHVERRNCSEKLRYTNLTQI